MLSSKLQGEPLSGRGGSSVEGGALPARAFVIPAANACGTPATGRAVDASPLAAASARAGAAALSGRQQRVASRSRSGAVRTYAAKQLHFNTNGEALKRMQVRSCSTLSAAGGHAASGALLDSACALLGPVRACMPKSSYLFFITHS